MGELRRADGPPYDRAGAEGVGVRTADIEADGDYLLSVTSDADDVMVRVGRDPANGVTPLRIGAVVVFVVGVVLAIMAFMRGRSQWTIPADGGPPPWEPERPMIPPIAPPYANPPTPPPYVPPPPGSGRPLPPPRPPG